MWIFTAREPRMRPVWNGEAALLPPVAKEIQTRFVGKFARNGCETA